VDKAGVKIGAIRGAPSDRVLTREIKAAEIVRYLVLTFPASSSVILKVDPSFIALPRQIPLESLRNPETFEYPAASICDFA
jgi:hypothetical protein